MRRYEWLEEEAGEYRVRGWVRRPLPALLLSLLTLGLLRKWWPARFLRATARPAPLHTATTLLLTDETGDEFVVEVKEEGPCRTFLCREEKFVWREGAWEPLRGLRPLPCNHLLSQYQGLDPQDRDGLRGLYGGNVVEVVVGSYWRLLVDEVLNPFYVFQIGSVVLWCVDEYVYYATCVVIISAISISISLVETKTQAQMLKDMAQGHDHTLIKVKNNKGQEEVVMSSELVPGDVVVIPPEGLVMPCDAVLLHGSCILNESMLTGESVPVQKTPLPPSPLPYDPDAHRRHTLFAGTHVIQTRFYPGAEVEAVVVRTGYATLKGALIRSILFPKQVNFKFYSDALRFVLLLFGLALGGMIYCLALYVHRGTAWPVTLVRVLDILTIVVPPALPAAMTVGTVYAQARLRAGQIFCISPPRINHAGKLKLMCFDKTGTLTEDGLDLWSVLPVEEKSGELGTGVSDPRELGLGSPLLRAMASCHSLTYIQGNLVGDPLDLKMFEGTGWELEEPLMPHQDTHKFDLLTPTIVKSGDLEVGIIRQFEFTPQLQRMSVVVRGMDGPSMVVYCKGAPEKIRPLCLSVPPNFDLVLDSLTAKGYRVLALAHKTLKRIPWHQLQRIHRDQVETDLVFCGLLVMQNSLKEATVGVIRELRAAAIRCVMLTGDNLLTAISVARESSIIPNTHKVILVTCTEDGKTDFVPAGGEGEERGTGDTVLGHSDYDLALTGRTWEALQDTAPPDLLHQILVKATIFARMSPENKSELVEALQDLGYVVGMCGDGANDCAALKMAHVGISLSEAEASVAAPFTSKVADVSCVPVLIREGRCALVTSFAIFKYMALYSIIQFASVLILYTYGTNLADTQFLYIDLGITTTMAVVMGRTGPAGRLVEGRPMASLVSAQNVAALLLHLALAVGVQGGAMAYLVAQPWYAPLRPHDPDDLPSLSWETTVIFSVSAFQYLILALVLSKGPPFRKPAYTNRVFVGCYLVLVGLTVWMVAYPPAPLATFLYLEEGGRGAFRAFLLLFPTANLLLAFLIETEWVGRVVKRLARLLCGKKEGSAYKRVLADIRLTWPPIKT